MRQLAYPASVWYKPLSVVCCQSSVVGQLRTVNRKLGTDNCELEDRMGIMEVAELKTVIGALQARVETIRDWL